MAFRELTPEDVARARAGEDPAVAAQLRCDRAVAEMLTAAGADVTFTEECDAEVVLPAGLPPERQLELAALAGQLARPDFAGRPRATRTPDGHWRLFSLLD